MSLNQARTAGLTLNIAPRLAGLHGDGPLELIAGAVLLPNREPAYDPLVEESAMVEFHVMKNRHGPCTHSHNPIRLIFPIARFFDLP